MEILQMEVAAIPFFVNINTFKPVIENQLTTALGRQAKLSELSLSIISGTVVAHDLQIADDTQFSTQPFLTAKELHIGVQVLPLVIHHQILVTSLEIDTPQIHLVRGANGVWNFSTIGQAAANRTQLQKQQSLVPNLTVDSLRIKNGHATVETLPAVGAPQIIDQSRPDGTELCLCQTISLYAERNSARTGHGNGNGQGRPNKPA